MQGCRQVRRTQPAADVFADHEHIEAFLEMKFARHPDTFDEFDELGATCQEDVLAVVDFMTVDGKRRRAST